MTTPHFVLKLSVEGRGKSAIVVVELPDGSRKQMGRGDLAEPRHRVKVVELICSEFPLVDEASVQQKVDALANAAIGPRHDAGDASDAAPYVVRDGCTYWSKRDGSDTSNVLLANFAVSIDREVRKDDGVEVVIEYEVVAVIDGQQHRRSVPARAFPGMNWVSEMLGARAIIEPGQGLRERLRVGIQKLCIQTLKSDTVYAHTGWRKIEGSGWCYLHGGGPIGPLGPVPHIGVDLPDSLTRLVLPDPSDRHALRESTAKVLQLLRLLPPKMAFAIVATPFRAALGGADFSLFLVGTTGCYKSELAALMQQFFGAEFHAKNLPASWSATANFLERLGFVAKDAVLVIDDYAPHGSRNDMQRFHRDADRVLRAQGNHSGRGRLTCEAQPKESKPPRGLYVVTGEDLPPGQSLLARAFILEVGKGEVSSATLSQFQADAVAGEYALCMAGFVQYAAGRYDAIQERHLDRVRELRVVAQGDGRHQRTSNTVAELMSAFEEFMYFLRTVPGALSDAEEQQLLVRCWNELLVVAASQSAQQATYTPVHMFLRLLSSALASGAAHVQGMDGGIPNVDSPAAFGWREERTDVPSDSTLRPKGACVGWTDGEFLYLDSDAAMKVAQSMADEGGRIPITAARLGKHLRENNLLARSDARDGHLGVRREIQGQRKRVLALALGALIEPVQVVQPVHNPAYVPAKPVSGPLVGTSGDHSPFRSGPAAQPSSPAQVPDAGVSGPDGPLGPLPRTGGAVGSADCGGGVQ